MVLSFPRGCPTAGGAKSAAIRGRHRVTRASVGFFVLDSSRGRLFLGISGGNNTGSEIGDLLIIYSFCSQRRVGPRFCLPSPWGVIGRVEPCPPQQVVLQLPTRGCGPGHAARPPAAWQPWQQPHPLPVPSVTLARALRSSNITYPNVGTSWYARTRRHPDSAPSLQFTGAGDAPSRHGIEED
jgi:hypothetical protein